jgi:hypothetical protein
MPRFVLPTSRRPLPFGSCPARCGGRSRRLPPSSRSTAPTKRTTASVPSTPFSAMLARSMGTALRNTTSSALTERGSPVASSRGVSAPSGSRPSLPRRSPPTPLGRCPKCWPSSPTRLTPCSISTTTTGTATRRSCRHATQHERSWRRSARELRAFGVGEVRGVPRARELAAGHHLHAAIARAAEVRLVEVVVLHGSSTSTTEAELEPGRALPDESTRTT